MQPHLMTPKGEDASENLRKEFAQFAFIVSHDLTGPLKQMRVLCDILEEEQQGDLKEESKKVLEIMKGVSQKGLDMLDSVLKLSRINTRGGERNSFDAGEWIEELEKKAGAQGFKAGQLEIEKDPSCKTIFGDRGQLTDAVGHLLDNCVKYRDLGRELKVLLNVTKKEGGIQILVEDNGMGIRTNDFDKIFPIFRKLHHVSDYPGLGVGLTFAKAIVNRHGGEIGVESELGKGSRFWFVLPNGSTSE